MANDLITMPNDELLELYQQISSRVGMYNTEDLILRMFAIRKELSGRFIRADATIQKCKEAARVEMVGETPRTLKLLKEALTGRDQDYGDVADLVDTIEAELRSALDELKEWRTGMRRIYDVPELTEEQKNMPGPAPVVPWKDYGKTRQG